MKRLPRTPAPRADEALFGYLLRLSEANCYADPRYLSYAANVPRTQRQAPFQSYPAEMLVPLVGGHEEALERMRYTTIVGNAVHSKLLDHHLGPDSRFPLRLSAPAVCVECVKEEGYIRAFWDLAAAVACPRHGRLAVQQCQTCNAPLAWYRPGLLRCRCNADIGVMVGLYADETLIDLMKVLEAKFERRPIVECLVTSKFPLHTFDAMPLFDLLRVIHVLGAALEFVAPVDRNDTPRGADSVRCAADLLLEWPQKFAEWIESVDKSYGGHIGTRALYRTVETLGRRKPLSEGLRSMKEALRPMLHARRGGVVAGASAAKSRREPIADAETYHSQTYFRRATAQLGIPGPTLNLLRSRGTYQSEVTGRKIQPWRPTEIEAFEKRLIALAEGKRASSGGRKLKALLSHKFNARVKAELIEAVLAEVLPVVGLEGDRPEDLLLETEAADRWVLDARRREGEGTITTCEAAIEIDLNTAAIPLAINAGLLEAVVVNDLTRVTLASVNRFRNLYVPIVQLARRFNTSTRGLARFIDRHGVRVIRLIRPGVPYAEQLIMLRESQSRVEELWAAKRAGEIAKNKRPANPGPARSTILAAYIESAKTQGKLLPTFGGRPNRKKIARACRFDRDEFYRRPELVRQIDQAYEEQQQRTGLVHVEPIERLRKFLKDLGDVGGRLPLWGGKPHLESIAATCGINRNLFYKDSGVSEAAEARQLVNDFAQRCRSGTERINISSRGQH